MTIRTLGVVGALFLVNGVVRAQSVGQVSTIGSMYSIIDVRSSALGESSVAIPGDPGAWNSNPASLAGVNGAGAQFISGHRSEEIASFATDWNGAGVWLATPVINVGFHYVKQDLGEFDQTFQSGDQGTQFHTYNETAALNLASKPIGPISLGANIKWTSDRTNALLPTDSSSSFSLANASGLYFDIGAIGTVPGFLNGGAMRDSISAGAALQDLGGGLEYATIGQAVGIAQWVRLGAAYSVAIGDSGTTTIRAVLSGEYKALINGNQQQNVHFGGIGFEATAFEIASLRLGYRFVSGPHYPSGTSTSQMVYGVGIHLPLPKAGIDLPLALGIDFAKLHETVDFGAQKSDLLLGIQIIYTGNLFGG